MDYLHHHYNKDFKIEELSDLVLVSLRTVERIFKNETGITLAKYQQIFRIIKSLELLSSQDLTVSEIAYEVGYKSLQAFTRSFLSVMHCRPGEFAKSIQ